jgi:hypothetical protein
MGHSPHDRSLSVRPDPRAPDGFLVHCFGAGNSLQEKRRVLALLKDMFSPAATPHLLPVAPVARVSPHAPRTGEALKIWHEARAPEGTPVEAYLHLHRHELTLPPNASEVMRFHPACPFARERTPALVCLVRDVVTNKPKAVHRTALSRDGRKITINGKDKLALGPVSGGAVKLTADEEVTTCLGVAEGIETALSLRKLPEFGPSPVWSLLSAGGVERLPVLPGIECLWLAVDNDEAGLRTTARTTERWENAGREVVLVTPTTPGSDLNDVLAGGRHG